MAVSEKQLLMLEINPSLQGTAAALRYSLVAVAPALPLRVELPLSVMSCLLISVTIVDSTRKHHSAP